jgi:S-adenosylmethionine/arginine decarboxylase-like enzyme
MVEEPIWNTLMVHVLELKRRNVKNNNYGKELILDLHGCDTKTFNRNCLSKYFNKLCKLIGVEACALHFWDDVGVPEDEKQTDPRLTGTSAVQFILTSNITVHTLDLLGQVYVNIFSCDDFDDDVAKDFTVKWFGGKIVNETKADRL